MTNDVAPRQKERAPLAQPADSSLKALGAISDLCAHWRVPCDSQLIAQRYPVLDLAAVVAALREFGFAVSLHAAKEHGAAPDRFPVIACLPSGLAFVAEEAEGLLPACEWIEAAPGSPAVKDPDGALCVEGRGFGFAWFARELMRHGTVWHQVLAASLFLQLLALGTPLVTQAVVDKVVVHRTESTLIALGIAMGIGIVFTAALTWTRQFLILHTGNRVDAVLGAAVFEHLFRLPVAYFERRPTGVIAARLHGVETIREFVASAGVSLLLDIPFLLIAVAVMFFYSVMLTLIALGVLGVVTIMSVLAAPLFRARLNHQFLLGARNQAFLTEHIAGHETVKSLQMEPLLRQRWSGYLASYLASGFSTKQVANSYNVAANALDQCMTLMILVAGAWLAMNPPQGGPVFTIGMLVAFQMFASRLSQPMMRLVGLWQQFQQAGLAVQRLGDVMNVPPEPYSLVPERRGESKGRIEFRGVGFRYDEGGPWLFRDVDLKIEPGRAITVMGPSGSGKSTLAKLLQGFHRPGEGSLTIDGVDVRHLPANELRNYFGVVPQETILFSGTVHDNLVAARADATFEEVVEACRQAEIHETIERLPHGYQTEIGERGTGLSGGQKQRIAIARALIKKPKVLVFDEATSALDPLTAEAFGATVNQLRGSVSLIFITHAVPRSLHVDEVYSMRNGQLRRVMARVPATEGRP